MIIKIIFKHFKTYKIRGIKSNLIFHPTPRVNIEKFTCYVVWGNSKRVWQHFFIEFQSLSSCLLTTTPLFISHLSLSLFSQPHISLLFPSSLLLFFLPCVFFLWCCFVACYLAGGHLGRRRVSCKLNHISFICYCVLLSFFSHVPHSPMFILSSCFFLRHHSFDSASGAFAPPLPLWLSRIVGQWRMGEGAPPSVVVS